MNLDDFFHPRGVALIGGIDRSDEQRLREVNDDRWGPGNWHLVNPSAEPVGSIPVHATIGDIAEPITLAVISTPATACAQIVRECGAADVPFALIFSSGFSEVGTEGAALEAELAAVAAAAGVRIMGPNTNTNAFERFPDGGPRHGGRIGVVTQSGHNGRPIVQGADLGVRFARLVPTGNEVDIDVCDVIEYFAADPDVAVITSYVEGFRDGGRLRRSLEASIESATPVVMMKIGSSAAGARMARTHTGHLVGSDDIVQAVFDRHGVARVRDLDELLETSALFAKLPPETGPRVALYSISGGSGTLMAELAELHGVPLAAFSDETIARLRRHIPDHLTVANPVDNGGTFVLQQPADVRRQVLADVLADPEVDVLVVGITGAVAPMTDMMAEDLEAVARESTKPVVATWNSPRIDEQGYRTLVSSGVPLFRSFRGCFEALAAFDRHRTAVQEGRERPAAVPERSSPGDMAGLLRSVGIDVAPQHVLKVGDDVERAVEGFGASLALKVVSVDAAHKSDLGLVRLDVAPADADAVVGELLGAASAAGIEVEGVVAQPMCSGIEMLVGVTSDPVLGHAVVVGAGGVHTEVFEDRAMRPVPLDRRDAEEMVRALRSYPLLGGHRGEPACDVDALVEVVLGVARLAELLSRELLELDLNPVIVSEQGAVVVDAMMLRGPDATVEVLG